METGPWSAGGRCGVGRGERPLSRLLLYDFQLRVDPDRAGYLVLAFKPDLLTPLVEYRRALSESLAAVKATPRLPGIESIRLPSEHSYAQRARNLREGIVIDRDIHEALVALAARA